MGILSVLLGYPQFVLRTLSLVGVPLVWWEYQQFGGGTLSLVPVHWFGDGTLGYFQFGWGSLGLVWEPLVTVSFGLGTLSFFRIPMVCLGTLGLVGLPQFGGVLSVWLGYPWFGRGILLMGYPWFDWGSPCLVRLPYV